MLESVIPDRVRARNVSYFSRHIDEGANGAFTGLSSLCPLFSFDINTGK